MSKEVIDAANSVGHAQDGEVNAEAIHGVHVAREQETKATCKTNSDKLSRAKELKDIGNSLAYSILKLNT